MTSIEDNRTPTIIATTVAPLTLSVIAVGARFLGRHVGGTKLWWDDWLVLLALVFFALAIAADLVGAHLGSGKHLQAVLEQHPGNLPDFLKLINSWSIYVGEIFYAPIIGCIKCSVLSLYIRLFGIHKTISRICYILISLTITWGIVTLLPTIFQCHPIHSAWNPLNGRNNCISLRQFLIGTNIPNILLDFLTLVMPWYPIWKLQLPLVKKMMIGGILLLGAFETAFSIIRLVYLTKLESSDVTWDILPTIVWSTIEISVGMICVCLPVIAPLVPRACCGRPSSKRSTKASRSEVQGREVGYVKRRFDRLVDDTKDLVTRDDKATGVGMGITRTTDISVYKGSNSMELLPIA